MGNEDLDEDSCPDPLDGANCELFLEEWVREFYEERFCKRDCPSVAEAAAFVEKVASDLLEERDVCKSSYRGFYYAWILTSEYTGQGCEYDLKELGFDDVVPDACELGKVARRHCVTK